MSDALDGGENRTHSVSMAYHEFTQMELVAIVCARDAEIERLRDIIARAAALAEREDYETPVAAVLKEGL
jgi:uncharacterized DUF497 family protein